MDLKLFSRQQRGILLTPDTELAALFKSLWNPQEIEWTVIAQGRRAMEIIFNEPPDILVVDNRLEDIPSAEVATIVKSENVYRQLPVILCLDNHDLERDWDWNEIEADDFLVRPFSTREARERVHLTLCRASRAMDANPLTKLPGNTSIIQRIQDLIDRKDDFALAYCDLDHFKSFNDKYGFSRGDEVLMMSARVIVNTIRSFPGVRSFVGHVGGDDFVFIVPADIAEEACKRVVAAFDDIVPHFYDGGDREKGCIISTDRQGEVRTFPLMAVSIAVVFNTGGRLKHYGEASAIAMGLKKKAKENPKSSYVLDRRTE
ncbi:MAG: diguanylate cyclase [Humidesulfovibrio sp.]|uniref:GGDEF domain-containing protein n=1 Tax=Humidesulfovibrio sp. TaxID=2910988 RepID=UPI002732D93D|nr:diguanylate cyclase [Humidesulfovibrio sp.]MDP2849112.1 diguanylate cyclase [Humidesulfovibrio sp.]